MSRTAWIYIGAVLLSGMLLGGLAWSDPPSPDVLPAFLVLTTFATLAQLHKTEVSGHTIYHATPLFFFAGLFMLPRSLYVLLVLVPCLIEWARERWVDSPHLREWYIQPFNIAMDILVGFGAIWLFDALPSASTVRPDPTQAASGLLAALAYIGLNHIVISGALILVRGVPWREAARPRTDPLLIELVLSCLGYVAALLWRQNPWLFLLALSPLLLIHRALTIPQLKREAQTDAKTGLLNARHFTRRFAGELDRARRFKRPVALILADLDLLRDINNTYGHLAGDTVLEGIGRIIRGNIRDYDIAGRFGGEEFAIVMPESGLKEAQALAERLRRTIELTPFATTTGTAAIHATMSFGIACFPEDARTTIALTHEADVAMYQAKLRGRNRVVCAVELPRRPAPGDQPREESPPTPYAAAFAPRAAVEKPEPLDP